MRVLALIPTDGTFHQERPIRRLAAGGKVKGIHSYDLKSATDRWPLVVIQTLLQSLFGSTLASAIVSGALGINSFHVGPPAGSIF